LYYTASRIIAPVGGRPVHRLREEVYTGCWWGTYGKENTWQSQESMGG